MIVSLIAHERNLGLLSVVDHLLDHFGKHSSSVLGWNYLVNDYSHFIAKAKELQKIKKLVIIKYVVPRSKFSGEVMSYPQELDEISDVVFRVPTYFEEISDKVPLIYFKNENESIAEHINCLYT